MKKEEYNIQEVVKDLVDLIQERASSGGPLHIVLEDDNIGTDSIKWCLENSIPKERDFVLKILCRELAKILLTLSLEERINYLAIDTDYIDIDYLLQKENNVTLKSLIEIKEEEDKIIVKDSVHSDSVPNLRLQDSFLNICTQYEIDKNNLISKEIIKRLPTEGIEYMIKIMQEELEGRNNVRCD